MEGGQPTTAAVRRRPFGIVVLSGLLILLAVLSGSALLGLRDAMPGSGNAALLEQFGNLAPVFGVVALCGVIPAVGLWLLRRWAWYWTVIWTGCALAYQILLFFAGYPNYAYMTIYVVAAFYLNQRDVKLLFEMRREQPPIVALEEDRSGPA
jgi:hypothetical protein